MTVSTFVQPDRTTQSGAQYPANIDASMAVVAQIAGQFAPHEQAVPNMTVRVDAGRMFVSGALVLVAAQSTGTITAPAVNPRIDRVVLDVNTGAVSVLTGVEAASPAPPAIPGGKFPCAQVLLQISSTVITNSMVTDDRAAQTTSSTQATAVIRKTASQSVPNTTVTAVTFDDEYMDDAGAHDTTVNNTRFTIPAGYTRAKMKGQLAWQTNSTGNRQASIRKNAASDVSVYITPVLATRISVETPLMAVSAGEYFELYAYQDSGVALNLFTGSTYETWFSIELFR